MIRVGVVGAGYWGPNLIRNFSKSKNCDLIYVCDLKEDLLKEIKEKYNVPTTTDFDTMLKEVDAVSIATPPATHFTLAKKALESGKHVLVEKPLAIKSKDIEELAKIANKNKLILMVGHTFEYVPAVEELKKIIKNKDLGEIYYLYTQRLNLGLWQPDSNVVWDLAPHDISMILYLLEEFPTSVSAIGKAHVEKNKEDVAFINLNFSNNKSAHLQVSWLDPVKTRKTVVVGDKKMAVYDDISRTEKLKIFEKKATQKYDTFEEFHVAYEHGKEQLIKVGEDEPLQIEIEHFLDCINTNKTPKSDAQDGLKVVKVIEAIQKSIKKNGESVNL